MNETQGPKDRLIAAAMHLMHSRGYTAVGINEICAEAGVRRGSFFHYFPTKKDIGLAVLDRQWEVTERDLLQPAFAKDAQPLERIRRMFRMCYDYQCAHRGASGQTLGCPFGILAAEMSTQEEAIRRRAQQVFADMAAYFTEALRELAEQEKVYVDAVSAGEALVAYLEGSLLMAKANDDPAMFNRLADLAVPLPVLG